MDRLIKCIFINANSIVSRHKRHYLKLFLDEHKPDILLMAEHGLSPRHKLDMDGYIIYRQNRQNGRGGTAIFVRDSINSERITIDTGSIENTTVKIRRLNDGTLTFVSLYRRPARTMSKDDFKSILDMAGEGSLVVAGDLNARHPYWGDTYTCCSGRRLHELLINNPNLVIHPTDGPTRVTNVSSSFIDVVFTSADMLPLTEGTGLQTLDYESDHKAIEISFGIADCIGRIKPTRLNYDKINRRLFNSTLNRELAGCMLPLNENVGEQEIDHCVNSLSQAFRKAIDISVPKILVGRKGLLKLPENILRFIAEKKRLRRVLKRCGDPGRCLILKADIRNLDRIIQGAIANFEREHWKQFLGNIQLNDKTFKTIRSVTGQNKRSTVHDLLDEGNTLVSDESGKANLLANYFSEVHQGGQETNIDSFSETVRDRLGELHNEPITTFGQSISANGVNAGSFGFVRAELVGAAIKRRSNKKSSGIDQIPDIVLKKTQSAVWLFLAVLFNHCINIGYFPRSWKQALVVPIAKPKSDPKICNSYRPISLLSPFGKLLESFILNRINDRILDGSILADSQFGFRSGHSTSHALMVFADYVARGLNKRYPTIAVSLDFAKAFDTVWQNGIIFKMMNLNFDNHLCRLVANFLSDRKLSVRVGDCRSNQKLVTAGVPQGSLLGPVLYNIYVHDIPKPSEGDLLLTYADDILLASSGARARSVNQKVNTYLAKLAEYFEKWKLRINIQKSTAIIIKGRRKYLYPNSRKFIPSLVIGSERLTVSDRIKYLGVIFHENFEYYRHIDFVLERTKRTFATYRSVLGRQGCLDKKVGLLLYRQVIRPLMSYAFPVWFRISSAQMERLRRWERRILVACLCLRHKQGPDGIYRRPSNRSVYGGIDFDRIDGYMVRAGMTFLDRASSLENCLVRECFERSASVDSIRSSKYMSPVDLLALRNAGLLYQGADLMFYHRRVNTLNINNIVYSTAQ